MFFFETAYTQETTVNKQTWNKQEINNKNTVGLKIDSVREFKTRNTSSS